MYKSLAAWSPAATAVGGTNVSPCPPRMPSTRLIAVFAVACINLNVAAAIAGRARGIAMIMNYEDMKTKMNDAF
jgi:hypothetical protein